MKKSIITLLVLSTFSFSQAQDILIPSERPIEDLAIQDSSLRGQINITVEDGSDNIIVDKTDKEDILFIQESSIQETEKRVTNYSMAVQTVNISSIDNLLKNGYSSNLEVYNGNTLISIAGLRNSVAMIDTAIKYKANLSKVNKNGDNFLHLATAYGKVKFFEDVKKLIDNETWSKLVLQENKSGRSLLHTMLMYNNQSLDLSKFLIKSGLNVNKVDNNNQTPLHYAALTGQWDILYEMIILGGDISLKDNNDISVEDYILKSLPIILAYKFFPQLSENGKTKIVDIIDKITLVNKGKYLLVED